MKNSALTFVAAGCVALASVALAAGPTVRDESFTVKPNSVGGGGVKCPHGSVPGGGGFALEQDGHEIFELKSAYPAGRSWKVASENFFDEKHEGSAIALCSKDDDLFVRTKKAENDPGSQEAQAIVRCPRGSAMLGGGGRALTPPDVRAQLRGSFPAGGERSWGARFFASTGDSSTFAVKAYVVCDKHAKDVEIVQGTYTTPAKRPGARRGTSYQAEAVAKCPKGKELTGGGFFSTELNVLYDRVGPKGDAWIVNARTYQNKTTSSFAVCQ